MQLKKPRNIRRALTAATCSLLGVTSSHVKVLAAQSPEWKIESSVLIYSESDDRVSAIEPVISARKEFKEDEFINIKVTLDALTGASPNGATPSNKVQTFTRPSGKGSYTTKAGETPLDDTFRDTRLAISTSWDKPLSRLKRRTLGVAVSREYDYTSLSVNGLLSKDSNDRNRTLQAGTSVAVDFIHPEGDIPIAFESMTGAGTEQPRDGATEDKITLDLLLGVTQIIGHNTIGQLNYSFSNSNGYNTDPFKILSTVDASSGETQDYVYESRPEERIKHSLYAEVRHFLGQDLINASYRFYIDNWGITSSTVELRYRWNLNEKFYIQPKIRWYQQSGADFYRHSLVAGEPFPENATADPRLGEFSATTLGIKAGYKFANGAEWNFRTEYYQQSADDHPSDAIGVLQNQDLFPETSAIIVQMGYSFKW